MFQVSQQINAFFPSDNGRDCTKDVIDGSSRGPFHRIVIRNGHSKDFRHERANHKHDIIEGHQKQSSCKYYQ